jgi:cyclophilin family peptidyl-prolyl cis-trans isomerase
MTKLIDYTITDGLGNIIDKRVDFRINKISDVVPEISDFLLSDQSAVHKTLCNGNVLHVTRSSTSSGCDFQDDLILNLIELKKIGNENVRRCNFTKALEIYIEGIQIIDEKLQRRSERDLTEIIIPFHLNRAFCCIKLGEWSQVISACNFVLSVDPKNSKALYRRAMARLENREFYDARRDLKNLLKMEPTNSDAIGLMRRLNSEDSRIAVSISSAGTDLNAALSKTCMFEEQQVGSPIASMEIQIDGQYIGTLRFRLHASRVPETVKNFNLLLYKYIGCRVFKAIKNQFFQTGDYEYNDGSGGDCAEQVSDKTIGNRRFFKDEDLSVHADGIPGLIGMASYGKDLNCSQFFVTLPPGQNSIGSTHVIFGHLLSGWDVLDRINDVANSARSDWRPLKEIRLRSVRIDSE